MTDSAGRTEQRHRCHHHGGQHHHQGNQHLGKRDGRQTAHATHGLDNHQERGQGPGTTGAGENPPGRDDTAEDRPSPERNGEKGLGTTCCGERQPGEKGTGGEGITRHGRTEKIGEGREPNRRTKEPARRTGMTALSVFNGDGGLRRTKEQSC